MERASVGPRDLDERPREDVLPRVLLHVIKARAQSTSPRRSRQARACLQHVPDCLTLERDLGHRHPAQGAPVRGLPASAGVERGRVERDPEAAAPARVADDRVEAPGAGVFVIEAPGQGTESLEWSG